MLPKDAIDFLIGRRPTLSLEPIFALLRNNLKVLLCYNTIVQRFLGHFSRSVAHKVGFGDLQGSGRKFARKYILQY